MRASHRPIAFLIVSCAAPPVFAQSAADLDARRQLLEQAVQARSSGEHQRAIDLFRRAGEIQNSASIYGNISHEYEALHEYAEALGSAQECASVAQREPPSRPRDAVLRQCTASAESLRSRVGRVSVQLATPPAGTQVRMGNRAIPQAVWGVPYAVNPGSVVIEVTAPGMEPYRREVTVHAGSTQSVEIALTAAAPAATASRDNTPPVIRATAPAATTSASVPAESNARGRSPLGLVVAGVGVVAAVAGGALWLVAGSQYGALQTACVTGAMPCETLESANRTRASIEMLDTIGLITAIGGGVIAIAGAVVYAASGHSPEAHPAAARVRFFDIGPGGITVRGTF